MHNLLVTRLWSKPAPNFWERFLKWQRHAGHAWIKGVLLGFAGQRLVRHFSMCTNKKRLYCSPLQWNQAVMLSWRGEAGPGSFCDYASRAVEEQFRDHELQINAFLKADVTSTHEDIEKWIDIIRSRGRSRFCFFYRISFSWRHVWNVHITITSLTKYAADHVKCAWTTRIVCPGFIRIETWMSLRMVKHFRTNKKPCFAVVLICVEEYMLRKVMLAAMEQGMNNGEYVFIYPNLLPSENWERLWYDPSVSISDNRRAMTAYRPLIQVCLCDRKGACFAFVSSQCLFEGGAFLRGAKNHGMCSRAWNSWLLWYHAGINKQISVLRYGSRLWDTVVFF